jgi:hypothetical protein
MARSLSALLLLVICFGTCCSQAPEGKKLIDEINAAKVKARHLGEEAELNRNEAREKNKPGDNAEHDKLIEEAAKTYGQASDALTEAANKANELAKLRSPSWYGEYFGLQASLIGNLAQLAAGAREELLVRKSGAPSESQVESWRKNLVRIREENEKFRKQITAIESRQGIVLIKE